MVKDIAVPPGAPAPLCLYAEAHLDRSETSVYLCNAGLNALTGVVVVTDCIPMFQLYHAAPNERWAEVIHTDTCRWDAIPSGRGVLLDTLSHKMWDLVSRHRLAFTDAAGRLWAAEVLDLDLNASRLEQDPQAVWVPILPERT
jgi:hypothetical protein